jgi:glycosyltransferase involved in cell wall biosynthesis
MKISIIIPVYNVEKYLKQCIVSVIQQSYKELEIILVDDGSTDNSGSICDEYIALDERVKVIHKSNEGLMSAWKTGFLSSSGKYIGFVDSDDWVDIDMFDQLVKNALSNDADIVVCQLIREFEEVSNPKKIEQLRLQPGVYNSARINNEILTGIINDGNFLGRKLSPNRVTKLFKRELLENNLIYCDDNISLGEDLVTCFSCVCDAKKIVILSDFSPYHYRINNLSITGKYDERRIEKVNKLNHQLQKIAKIKGLNIPNQIANDYISLALLCIEIEILFAPFPKNIIIDHIKEISKLDSFTKSLKNGNFEKFSFKYKLYLFFIKKGNYNSLFLFRKMISKLNQFIK